MRVNKKGVNRSALVMFKIAIANRLAVANFSDGLATEMDKKIPGSFRKGFLLGAARETLDFFQENLQELSDYNYISAQEAFAEIVEVLEADSFEVGEMLEIAGDFLSETEKDKEEQVIFELK